MTWGGKHSRFWCLVYIVSWPMFPAARLLNKAHLQKWSTKPEYKLRLDLGNINPIYKRELNKPDVRQV